MAFKIIVAAFLVGTATATGKAQSPKPVPNKYAQPVKVTIEKKGGSYQLTRGGVAFFVKGAGGTQYPARLAAYGGNSMRTWGSGNGQQVLDSAQKYGLTVLMGLDVARERHGFDYNDTAAVQKQLLRLRAEVEKYKNHPALLAWGIGNELNLQYKNPAVWNAVNGIAKMIHELDPNHPTTTALAGISKEVVAEIKDRAPDVDFLSVNTYAGLATVPQAIAAAGWDGAYMVTEWGPTGHWEGLSTAWKAPIEETSSEKAAVYKSRYEASVERNKAKCMGSYVFLWGQKQERTPTWYGLFTEGGEESEVMDVMQYLWTGAWPNNKAPHLYSLQVDGKKATNDVYLKPGNDYNITVTAADPDGDALAYRWELLPEATEVGEGGDYERRPQPIPNSITTARGRKGAVLKTPAKGGAYRLFVYVSDGHNNVATANFPFYVE